MNTYATHRNTGRGIGRMHLAAVASAALLAISLAATVSAAGTPTAPSR
jgi:hypothetical protein